MNGLTNIQMILDEGTHKYPNISYWMDSQTQMLLDEGTHKHTNIYWMKTLRYMNIDELLEDTHKYTNITLRRNTQILLDEDSLIYKCY